jgi:hypothetical protein
MLASVAICVVIEGVSGGAVSEPHQRLRAIREVLLEFYLVQRDSSRV